MSTTAVSRPAGVTIVAIVTFVQAFFAILGGLALVVERNDQALLAHVERSSSTLTTYGVIGIVWGVIALVVARGLWNGADWARILVGILQVLNIAGGVYLLFAWGGTYLWSGIWQIGIGLVVLYFLFGARGEAYFTAPRAT